MDANGKERYARNILVEGVGEDGQEKLLQAKVLIIGAGGLGSPVAMYLAAAGIGTIGIADADCVDLSNLQRQILHGTKDIGKSKVQSAKEMLQMLNEQVTVHTYPIFLDKEYAEKIILDYDIVVDATDNFDSKFMINDICVALEKPYIHGGVLGFGGQVMTYVPGQGPCYRCLFPDIPKEGEVPTARQTGVIGAAAGVIGSLQAIEVIKILTGTGDLLTGAFLSVDTKSMTIKKLKMPPENPECPVCGKRKLSN